MTGKPLLAYFGVRGRAEPIRMLLEDAGVAYDFRNCSECWPTEKAKKDVYHFGQVPALTIGDRTLVQTEAIIRYLARKYKYTGTNEIEMENADMMAGHVADMKLEYGRLIYGGEFEKQVGEFVSTKIPKGLELAEHFLEKVSKITKEKGFVAGDHITFADFLLFDICMNFTYLDQGCLDKYPIVKAWYHRMEARENYVAYVKSGRRPKMVNGNAFGNPKDE